MSDAAGDEGCLHASCGCRASGRYAGCCSLYCANARRDEPPVGACACGHPDCVAAQQGEPADDETVSSIGPVRKGS